jgi:uncharacterized membrane protein YgcG
MMTLRPASQLREQRENKISAERERGHRLALERTVKAIEDAHASRKKEVSILTIPDSVVKELEANGYKVELVSAWHYGDVETHRIQWD